MDLVLLARLLVVSCVDLVALTLSVELVALLVLVALVAVVD